MRLSIAACSVLAFSVVALVVACSSSGDSSSSGSSGSSSGASGGSGGPPADCVSQCTTQASGCGQDSSRCSQLCSSITGAQFSCIKAAGCDEDAANDCLKTGGSSGTSGTSGSSGTSGTSGSSGGTCKKIGESGCSSLNAPSGCCTDVNPDVVCNGNNDGKGNAQCCVNTGKSCTKDSDCCGNAGAPTIYKCCSNKCGSGC